MEDNIDRVRDDQWANFKPMSPAEKRDKWPDSSDPATNRRNSDKRFEQMAKESEYFRWLAGAGKRQDDFRGDLSDRNKPDEVDKITEGDEIDKAVGNVFGIRGPLLTYKHRWRHNDMVLKAGMILPSEITLVDGQPLPDHKMPEAPAGAVWPSGQVHYVGDAFYGTFMRYYDKTSRHVLVDYWNSETMMSVDDLAWMKVRGHWAHNRGAAYVLVNEGIDWSKVTAEIVRQVTELDTDTGVPISVVLVPDAPQEEDDAESERDKQWRAMKRRNWAANPNNEGRPNPYED